MPPGDPRGVIERQLLPGERVLWIGQPDVDLTSHEMTRGIATICGVIVVVSLIGLWAVSRFAVPHLPLIVALLAAGGLVIVLTVASPRQYRTRIGKAIYAITDRRAIVYDGFGWSLLWLDLLPELHDTVWSFDPIQIRARRRIPRYRGRTDLVFDGERHYHFTGKGAIRDWVQVGFLGLKDVDAVDQLLEELVSR